MSEQPLQGAVALVTGATGGIGRATARRLVRAGAAVALVARGGDRLDEIAADLRALGGHAVAVAADITDPALAYQAVEDTHERLGRLDVLVNSDSVMVLDTALHTPIEEWDRMISLNVSAMLHVTHAAVPYLIDAAATSPRGVADLVNVGSPAGRIARRAGSVYSLTEFGRAGFTESLRQELLPERVRVSMVAPGVADESAHRQPGRPEALRPEDIADTIAYIVTRERRVAVNEIVLRAGGQNW
ncbi:SDR family oxidoreductase [Nocardia noduli]|uniref:SDR family oxidoreductase n=1 Tax=Nocardia noduli TaxID=2815722 RepID=UPI001C223EC1|nr:SDR family NAD(P)-dependent oxidoreductase [Nocardia noduli]